MLSERKEHILRIIVGEYISLASPVGSEAIARRYGLGLSAATIRNEMARLEEDGYIIRPHISGGSVPSDRGYRYYVESMVQEEVPLEEQRMLSHLFHQVERELAEWNRLAAALLARMVHNVAIVTSPKAAASRIKHLELVALQESLVLLILLLQQAKLKQQLIAFDKVISQGELGTISRKLNALFQGLTRSQVLARSEGLSPIEEQVKNAVVQIMAGEDERRYEEPYIEGLRHILTQPEFAHAQNMLCLMEVLESRDMVRYLLPEMLVEGGVRVIIGAENREDALKECSMVVTRYGVPGEVNGVLGVIGPRRMPYGRAISSVRYMGSLMSDLVAELYTGPGRQ
ncbi:MAG: heat-inducible transcription repressor HrcA [Dehalococcoidia bacterium]|nr:MAG: heat-inducible transcription repressor HrcA [Dehalococcoidia bacterium]